MPQRRLRGYTVNCECTSLNSVVSPFKRKQGNNLDKAKENISELKQSNVFMHCLEGILKKYKETEK